MVSGMGRFGVVLLWGWGCLEVWGLHKVETRYSPVKLIAQVLYEGLVGWRVGKD